MTHALDTAAAPRLDAQSYDGRTMLFHWLTVLLVAGQWLGAHAIDWFPKGALRIDARSTHIVFGSLLALVILARLIWRLGPARRLPPADKGALQLLAKVVHGLLYALVITTVALGATLAVLRGDSLFGLFNLPSVAGVSRDTKEQMQNLHGLSANLILVVAAVHAGAALIHQYLWKDGLLGRMIPPLRGR